jgi:hypothetical protein
VSVKVAALNTVDEIETLIESLNQTITDWKIKNL